jgi:tryptophanase
LLRLLVRVTSVAVKTIIEPFRIKSVEPLRFTTREERERALSEAGWNLFRVPSELVLIDLLTDSGTGAMSADQWAGIMRGDESYAGSPSFTHFEKTVRETTGFPIVIPTHQGRAAERILFGVALKPGDAVVSNTLFDTTRANIEHDGGEGVDLPAPEARRPQDRAPFKGNIDLEALERFLDGPGRGRTAMVLLTLTNNAGGGQPLSLANARAARDIADKRGVPLWIDACRFAENAYLVKLREDGQGARSAKEIAREFFSLAEGCTMSAKKDGLANIGGFIGLRDEALAQKARALLILTEGFPTYGGLAGRDLEAIAQGLEEVLHEDYLEYRLASVRYLAEGLAHGGIPVMQPPGGHAVYIDAGAELAHIPVTQFPGQALACALYLEAGIRACEIGSLMLGKGSLDDGSFEPARLELVRLALPRRTYTQSHVDYVIEAALDLHARREKIRGIRLVEDPVVLRHFTARMEPV